MKYSPTCESLARDIATYLGIGGNSVSVKPNFDNGRFAGTYTITLDTLGQVVRRGEVLRHNIRMSLECLTNSNISPDTVTVSDLTIARYKVSVIDHDWHTGILDYNKLRISEQFKMVLANAGYAGHVVERVNMEDMREEFDNTVRHEFTVRYRW